MRTSGDAARRAERARARADHVPLPRWLSVGAGILVVYVSACLPLALLPYAGGEENSYNAGQRLIANIGPLLATALMVGTAIRMIRRRPA